MSLPQRECPRLARRSPLSSTVSTTGRRRRRSVREVADRQCSRTACGDPAAFVLSYDYGRRLAWLDVISGPREPHSYDLCARHAAGVSVPNGWRLDDRRRADTDRLAG